MYSRGVGGSVLFILLFVVVVIDGKFVKLTDDNLDDKLASGEWLILL
jgi:hypothetical protein